MTQVNRPLSGDDASTVADFVETTVVGNRPSGRGHLIVGIGASADDLAAYQSFFKAMPDHSGAAFVLVQHLDPNYESALAKIIGQSTALPVVQAFDGTIAAPNTGFSHPAGCNLEDR